MALGLVPRLGSGSLAHFARPAYHHFHSLMRASQGHGDSGEGRNPRVGGFRSAGAGSQPSIRSAPGERFSSPYVAFTGP